MLVDIWTWLTGLIPPGVAQILGSIGLLIIVVSFMAWLVRKGKFPVGAIVLGLIMAIPAAVPTILPLVEKLFGVALAAVAGSLAIL